LVQRSAKRGVRESTVLPGSEPIRDLPWAPPDEFKQRLRIRRFLLGSLFSVMYLLVVAVFSTLGKADLTTVIAGARSWRVLTGLHPRSAPDSISSSPTRASPGGSCWRWVGTMLFVLYRSPETRLATRSSLSH
jgi:hypothetical protein